MQKITGREEVEYYTNIKNIISSILKRYKIFNDYDDMVSYCCYRYLVTRSKIGERVDLSIGVHHWRLDYLRRYGPYTRDHNRRFIYVNLEDKLSDCLSYSINEDPLKYEDLYNSIEKLNSRDKQIIYDYYIFGLKQTEIASLLKVSTSRVSQLVERSLELLRKDLKDV